jgi:hypothetical protein
VDDVLASAPNGRAAEAADTAAGTPDATA